MRRVANAQIVLTAPVEVTSTPSPRGTAAAGLIALAGSRKTSAVSGYCTVGLGSARNGVAVHPVTGRCLIGLTARRASVAAVSVAGRCVLGLTASTSGAAQSAGIKAGPPVYQPDVAGQETVVALPPSYTLGIVCGQPLQVLLPVLTGGGTPIAAAAIASARAQVRADWQNPMVLHEWTTTGTAPNASIGAGGVTLTATTAQTINWQVQWPANAVWDLQVVDTFGVEHRLTSAGPIRLYPAITR